MHIHARGPRFMVSSRRTPDVLMVLRVAAVCGEKQKMHCFDLMFCNVLKTDNACFLVHKEPDLQFVVDKLAEASPLFDHE